MKTKIIACEIDPDFSFYDNSLVEGINKFVADKQVIDIKYQASPYTNRYTGDTYVYQTALIMYEDIQNGAGS